MNRDDSSHWGESDAVPEFPFPPGPAGPRNGASTPPLTSYVAQRKDGNNVPHSHSVKGWDKEPQGRPVLSYEPAKATPLSHSGPIAYDTRYYGDSITHYDSSRHSHARAPHSGYRQASPESDLGIPVPDPHSRDQANYTTTGPYMSSSNDDYDSDDDPPSNHFQPVGSHSQERQATPVRWIPNTSTRSNRNDSVPEGHWGQAIQAAFDRQSEAQSRDSKPRRGFVPLELYTQASGTLTGTQGYPRIPSMPPSQEGHRGSRHGRK